MAMLLLQSEAITLIISKSEESFLFRPGNKTEQPPTFIHWSGPLRRYCTMVSQCVYTPMTHFVSNESLNFNKIIRHHSDCDHCDLNSSWTPQWNNEGVSQEALVPACWYCYGFILWSELCNSCSSPPHNIKFDWFARCPSFRGFLWEVGLIHCIRIP